MLLLAFAPLFMATPATADPRSDYDALVAQAQAKFDNAKKALQEAQDALANAQTLKITVDQSVADAQAVLNDKLSTLSDKKQALVQAKQDLLTAQSNYDNNTIPDPNWVAPTQEIQVPYDVEYTVDVPVTRLVPHTISTTSGGVKAEVFNRLGYNAAPPLPNANEQPIYTTPISTINYNWGSGEILGSGKYEDIIVKFTGNLLFPTDGYYYFYTPADDGTILDVAGMRLISDWRDKGGGGSSSQATWIRGGVLYPFTLYYYENGGGAAVSLQYRTDTTSWSVVPANYLGQTITEEVVMVEETIMVPETRVRTEFRTEVVPVPGAVAPQIKDPTLKTIVDASQTIVGDATSNLDTAQSNYDSANQSLVTAQAVKSQNDATMDSAQVSVNTAQGELNIAQSELEAIPPFKEPTPTPTQTTEPTQVPEIPVTPEIPEPITPTTPELPVNVDTVDPQTLSDAQVTELISVANEILNNSEQGSPEYQQALDALFVAAQADDIVIDPSLAAIPGLSAAVDAINFMGNVGSDMSPKVRAQSKKVVVTAVVAVGAAVNAATGAALASVASTGTSPITRRKE